MSIALLACKIMQRTECLSWSRHWKCEPEGTWFCSSEARCVDKCELVFRMQQTATSSVSKAVRPANVPVLTDANWFRLITLSKNGTKKRWDQYARFKRFKMQTVFAARLGQQVSFQATESICCSLDSCWKQYQYFSKITKHRFCWDIMIIFYFLFFRMQQQA